MASHNSNYNSKKKKKKKKLYETNEGEEKEEQVLKETSQPPAKFLEDPREEDPIVFLAYMHQNNEDQKYCSNNPHLGLLCTKAEVPQGEFSLASAPRGEFLLASTPPGQPPIPARAEPATVARMPTHARADDQGLNHPSTGVVPKRKASRNIMVSRLDNQQPCNRRMKDPPLLTGHHLDPPLASIFDNDDLLLDTDVGPTDKDVVELPSPRSSPIYHQWSTTEDSLSTSGQQHDDPDMPRLSHFETIISEFRSPMSSPSYQQLWRTGDSLAPGWRYDDKSYPTTGDTDSSMDGIATSGLPEGILEGTTLARSDQRSNEEVGSYQNPIVVNENLNIDGDSADYNGPSYDCIYGHDDDDDDDQIQKALFETKFLEDWWVWN